MAAQEFTDLQRKKITQEAYNDENYILGTETSIDKGKTSLGTVVKVVRGRDNVEGDDPTGLDAVAIKDEKTKTIRIIFQGSQGSMFNSKDWSGNDWPMWGKHIVDGKGATPQLERAAAFTKKVLAENKGYSFEVYGHSLGSMDGQYAIASLSTQEASRLKGAWLYEGPNVYNVLDDEKRRRVDKYRNKINNYLDHRDIVPFGYVDPDHVIGNTFYVDSAFAGGKDIGDYIGRQHNWGGYQFTKDGKIVLESDSIKDMERISINTLKGYYPSAIGMYRLPSSERIFIDAIQACAVVKAIDSQIDSLEFHMQALKDKALGEAESDWAGIVDNLHVYYASHLSEEEIISALEAVGWSKEAFMGKVKESIDKLERAVKQECRKMCGTGEQVKAGIAKLVEKDSSLGRNIENYNIGILPQRGPTFGGR